MVRLKLNFWGTFQAVLDGRPLTTFRSDKVRALLAYLAMEGERPQLRDTLANLLWSNYPQDAARTSLRQALSNLHRTLAPLKSAGKPLLTITHQDIIQTGSHPNVLVDTLRFDKLLAECARHVHQDLTRCSQCIRRLGEATPDAVTYSSLKLFAERADRTPVGFLLSPDIVPDVVQVCRLVEGIPLGIELAAALVEQVSPAGIAGTIRQNLAFLATTMTDIPARHRSMHAVFDYSWQLLTLNEQQALAQISIFQGTFDLPAAGAILELNENPAAAPTEGDKSTIHKLLSSAVDKSLLRYLGDGRYEMHQLLRQFTAEKLKTITPDERLVETIRKRHIHYYLSYVGDQKAALHGQKLPQALTDIRREMDSLAVGHPP